MTRRCSHCGHNGHNSRTCPDRGVRLFGVRLTDSATAAASCKTSSPTTPNTVAMRKSASMGNLSLSSANGAVRESSTTPEQSESGGDGGYVSDGLVQTSRNTRERRKGVPWTEEEHRRFLLGLAKLGKGDWRGISRHYVSTRTPTQVASHAQKYYIRQSNLALNRRRRSSLFDIPSAESESHGPLLEPHGQLLSNPPLTNMSHSAEIPYHLHPIAEHCQLYHPHPVVEAEENPPPFFPVYFGLPLQPGAFPESGAADPKEKTPPPVPPRLLQDPHEELTRLTLGSSFSSLRPPPSPARPTIKMEPGSPFATSPSVPGSSRSNPIRVI